MKVYILYGLFDDDLIGVFSTRELAEKIRDKEESKYPETKRIYKDEHFLYIEEADIIDKIDKT